MFSDVSGIRMPRLCRIFGIDPGYSVCRMIRMVGCVQLYVLIKTGTWETFAPLRHPTEHSVLRASDIPNIRHTEYPTYRISRAYPCGIQTYRPSDMGRIIRHTVQSDSKNRPAVPPDAAGAERDHQRLPARHDGVEKVMEQVPPGLLQSVHCDGHTGRRVLQAYCLQRPELVLPWRQIFR